jgi:hypothetical protein
MEYPIRTVLHRDTDRATDYNNDRTRTDHHYSGDDNHNMGANYNIHGTDDDLYYYCPNNECPCRGTTDHRGNDNHLVFYYDDNDYWKHHRFGYSPPDDHGPDRTRDNDSATDDDYQHYDHIFGSYNDGDDFHPAYRTAYNDYLATKRQPTTA